MTPYDGYKAIVELVCPWCGKKFNRKWNLKGCWHFWRITNWKSQLCWKCHDREHDGA